MQQLMFVKPGSVEWHDIPAPSVEADTDITVRPVAVATCDLDAAIARGLFPANGPFPLGHEFIAEVIEAGDRSHRAPGDLVAVPFQISCGSCARCRRGLTANCTSVPARSMYGLGDLGGDWGGALSDVVRVPFADHMAVPLPSGVDPVVAASVGDNISDAWRAVVPPLERLPGSPVLVVGGGGASSIGLYAVDLALAHGAPTVTYVDHDEHRLRIAEQLGATVEVAEGAPRPGLYDAPFPDRLGPYPITVDASAHHAGIALAMAHFTALSAARIHVLERVGWDVNEDGLSAAPPIRDVVGADRHITVDRALRYLGIGRRSIVPAATDADGRIIPSSLAEAVSGGSGPTIVCAQVGEVNTGAIDPLGDVCEIGHGAGAWVHLDGAFGMWAAASPTLRPLVEGIELADSWATDAHKWLNVPYDSGLAFCAHPDSHRRAMSAHADYLLHADSETGPRDELDWNPEFSRRARGFPIYAALRSLGHRGVAALVEGSCEHARRLASALEETDGVEVINDVRLNQVLVRFGDDDAQTESVIRGVQEEGECWMSGTT